MGSSTPKKVLDLKIRAVAQCKIVEVDLVSCGKPNIASNKDEEGVRSRSMNGILESVQGLKINYRHFVSFFISSVAKIFAPTWMTSKRIYFQDLSYTTCFIVVKPRYADLLKNSTVTYKIASRCFYCTFEVLVFAKQPYLHTEHSVPEIIVRNEIFGI